MEDWIKITDKEPKKYQDAIVCSDSGVVKSAIYLGNYKWTTYTNVILWMPMPTAPEEVINKAVEDGVVTQPKKKRGRKKKVS